SSDVCSSDLSMALRRGSVHYPRSHKPARLTSCAGRIGERCPKRSCRGGSRRRSGRPRSFRRSPGLARGAPQSPRLFPRPGAEFHPPLGVIGPLTVFLRQRVLESDLISNLGVGSRNIVLSGFTYLKDRKTGTACPIEKLHY